MKRNLVQITVIDTLSEDIRTIATETDEEVTPQFVLDAMLKDESTRCDIPIEDCAGFNMKVWVPNGASEFAFIAITTGLGPDEGNNFLFPGAVYVTRRIDLAKE